VYRFSSFFDVQNIVTLKSRLGITRYTQGHFMVIKWHHSIDRIRIFVFHCNHIVTEIFSVEYWRDLEIQVRGSLRSLKMAPIDRSCTTLYWSAVVTITLSCTIFELFDVQNIVTLNSRLWVIQVRWKWHHSIDRIRVHTRLPL